MSDPAAEIAALGAVDIAARYRDGALSAREVVAALSERIDAHNPRLHALIALAPDALDQAAAADTRRAAGLTRSPLDGVPVIVKDNIEARGLPGSAGSLALAGSPARRDAELVRRLRHAGLVVLGAANLSEWANMRGIASTSGWSALGGLTDNPWQSGASAGGSSSGSGAALAAGLTPLAVGTETDGSIVCPSSLCGVVGLKPTVGTVPTHGVIPIANSQDSPGPMARNVADAAALARVLSGGLLGANVNPAALRVGFVPGWGCGTAAVDDLVAGAVAGLARTHQVREIAVPAWDDGVGADEVIVLTHELGDDLDHYLANRPGIGPRSLADVVAFNEANASTELAHFGQEYLELALGSGGRRSPKYAPARSRNLDWAMGSLAVALGPARDQVDVLVGLAYGPAWRSNLTTGDNFNSGYATHASAIAGWPLACVPVGTVGDLPVGLAIAGGPGSEDLLLWVAAQVARHVAETGHLIGLVAPL